MTGLLVSVRNLAEAQAAVRGGAHVIDVKEPRKGSLGAADPRVIVEVLGGVEKLATTSVALGELADHDSSDVVRPTLFGSNEQPFGEPHFAKLGLAGLADRSDWPSMWHMAMTSLPRKTRPVAVAYADWQIANAPSPMDVLRATDDVAAALLIDTWDKSQGGLDQHLAMGELLDLRAATRSRDMLLVLAGSIRREQLAFALSAEPDYIAVRGAVCRGNRAGSLREDLVREFADAMAASSPKATI